MENVFHRIGERKATRGKRFDVLTRTQPIDKGRIEQREGTLETRQRAIAGYLQECAVVQSRYG